MNLPPGVSSGLARNNGPVSSHSRTYTPATSPTSAKAGPGRGRKRTQDNAGLDSSPGSGEGEAEEHDDRRRQPGVKRACNECRQQKVSRHPLLSSLHSLQSSVTYIKSLNRLHGRNRELNCPKHHSFVVTSFKSPLTSPVDDANA